MSTQIAVRFGREKTLQISWLFFTHSFNFSTLKEALTHLGKTLADFHRKENTPIPLADCCKKVETSYSFCPQCGRNLKDKYQESMEDLRDLLLEFLWVSSRANILEEFLEDAGWSLREEPAPDCYKVFQDADELIACLGFGIPLRQNLKKLI